MSDSIPAEAFPLVIANGTNVSTQVSARYHYGDAYAIAIFSPVGLEAHTFVFEGAYDPDNPVWFTLKTGSPLAAIPIPAAGDVAVYYELADIPMFRIKDTTGNVAAARTFYMVRKTRNSD